MMIIGADFVVETKYIMLMEVGEITAGPFQISGRSLCVVINEF